MSSLRLNSSPGLISIVSDARVVAHKNPIFFIRILEISPQNVPILEQNPAKTGKFHPNFPILRSSLEEDISKAIGPIFKIFDFY